MPDLYFERCKKLRKKLVKRGVLVYVTGSVCYTKWKAELTDSAGRECLFVSEHTPEDPPPLEFTIEFFANDVGRCSLSIHSDSPPDMNGKTASPRTLKDLDAFLKHNGV